MPPPWMPWKWFGARIADLANNHHTQYRSTVSPDHLSAKTEILQAIIGWYLEMVTAPTVKGKTMDAKLSKKVCEKCNCQFSDYPCEPSECYMLDAVENAIEVPCKIGDFVWAIRNFKGKKHPQRGVVSDMYFLKDMSLQIVVKYVARGKWGETVFATDKEAYAAIEGRKPE